MLFTSLSFLLFLPVVFAVYWLLHRRLTWQNIWLVAASYVFYGWWDVRFLGLIILTSACSYLCALAIERAFDDGEERHAWLFSATNIILNLAILGVFKYYDFFVESFARLLSMMGLHADVPTLHLILPVGISFALRLQGNMLKPESGVSNTDFTARNIVVDQLLLEQTTFHSDTLIDAIPAPPVNSVLCVYPLA